MLLVSVGPTQPLGSYKVDAQNFHFKSPCALLELFEIKLFLKRFSKHGEEQRKKRARAPGALKIFMGNFLYI